MTNTREKKISRAEKSALAGCVRGWHLIMVEKAWRSSLRCVDQEAEKRDGAITRIPARTPANRREPPTLGQVSTFS